MNKFKKIFLVFLLFAALLNFSVIFLGALDISAQSGILICADSGSIIWNKNETEPLPMASTTKIMTSLLALEHMEACGNKEIEITEEMVRVEGTSMGLKAGNIVNLEALVQGMLLCSGNDAANAAAIAVGGDVNNFLDLMNEKAKMIGMENTKFSTPSGLDKDNHHSTAKDMAILGAYAMENENFLKIASQKSMPVKFLSPNKTVRLKNHNKLLRLYDGCIGVKTGFTKLAGRCLVSCAEKNGVRLICVTLNAPNDWDDHTNLYNFGFENTVSKKFCDVGFKISVPLKNSSEGNLECECGSEFSAVFKKGDELKITRQVEIPEVLESPIERGQIVGKVVYYLDGKIVGKNDILSLREVKKIKVKKFDFFYGIVDLFRKLLGGK
ncbi:MAG: D-alanyl-D-alanine carboxypeptidase [Clostridia bacterium]|nr:D-alanyl-D-alanine carboxypeptidase [Clostridia bacterium]